MNPDTHENSLTEANTALRSDPNIQVGLGESQKIVTGRDHFGRVWQKETQVPQHSLECKAQLFPCEHLESPSRPPDASQRSVAAAAKQSCL